MGLIKNFILKRALIKGMSVSASDKAADEILIGAVKEMQQTGKTAQKLLQAKMLRAESKKTLSDIAALNEDDYIDDDEEDDKEEDFGVKDILSILGNLPKNNQQSQDPYAENPTAPIKKGLDAASIMEIAKTLSPEQKKIVRSKFGIDI